MIHHANINQQKAWVAVLVSDKVYFRAKEMIRDGAGYHIRMEGSVQPQSLQSTRSKKKLFFGHISHVSSSQRPRVASGQQRVRISIIAGSSLGRVALGC